MNQKLLVLILVLGMFSMAKAGLSFVVGDGTTFTDPGDEISIGINNTIWIGIYDSLGEMYIAPIISYPYFESCEWTGNSAVYSPPAISTAPGWTHIIQSDIEWWFVDLTDSDSTETPLPGVGCAVELRALSEGFFPIDLNTTPGSGPEDVLILHIIPEPATVLLLALGSLALVGRRR